MSPAGSVSGVPRDDRRADRWHSYQAATAPGAGQRQYSSVSISAWVAGW